jgi:murein DD-endopeptidase MepM/ murein hydrolase activator NlpD
MTRLRVLLPVALIILSGCAPAPSPLSTSQPIIQSPTPSPTSTPSYSSPIAPIATAIIPIGETSTPFPLTEAPAPLPTATPGAMQLFFPTVIPVQGAEYRPPLYPIPWSLSPFDHFYFAAPIAAAYPGEPEWDYPYGGVFFGPNIIHTGVDLPAPRGTDVLAAGPGTVVWAGIGLYTGSSDSLNDPYGKAVAIRQDFGYQDQQLYTIYAHMDEVDVAVGQWVNTGAVIGKVGSTGNTTGPHLHFEVRVGEDSFYATRNPVLWMVPAQGYGVLVGRVTADYGSTLKDHLVTVTNIQTQKYWKVYTYASDATIHSDTYYNENVALGNLPAGVYQISIIFDGMYNQVNIQILPGQVTYFTFNGFIKYNFSLPPTPTSTTTASPNTP